MRISREAIYQALFVQGRGALRRELTACLRSGRTLRLPRARIGQRGKSFVSPEIMISERHAEADDRAASGHWEGDLGLGSSAIGTRVERTTRFTMLLHLPRMEYHGAARGVVRNRQALAGHGAEMVQHMQLKVDAGVDVYSCDPQSPWQRGTNKNTNTLLRQYFPNGTDLSAHSADTLAAVAATLNGRPRKTLGCKMPGEVSDQCLAQIDKHPVATTG